MSQVLINIRNIRVSKGYSQEYVASSIGISQSSYTRFESGRSKTLFEIIEKVAVFFEMPVTALINHHKHPHYTGSNDDNTLAEEAENYQLLAEELAHLRQRVSIHDAQMEALSLQVKDLKSKNQRAKRRVK